MATTLDRFLFKALFIVTALIAASALDAQGPGAGSIVGTVTDPDGAALAKANVTVAHEGTLASRSVVTSSEGAFRFALLPPGTYSITIEATGFQRKIVKSARVITSESTTLEIKLAIGKADETVQVTSTPELVQAESSALGRAVDDRTIQALPLANRNYTQTLALSPGVVVELPNAAALGRNNQNVSANGNKTTANNLQFNGVDANNLSQNSASGYHLKSAPPSPLPIPSKISRCRPEALTRDSVEAQEPMSTSSARLARIIFTAVHGNFSATMFSMRTISFPKATVSPAP